MLLSSSTLVDPTKMANYDGAIPSGQIPTYAPARQITLVHAVQQPAPPGGPVLTPGTRVEGQTNVALSGSVAVDGATSSHLDLVASWTEYVDTELTAGVTVVNGIRQVQKTGRVQTWTVAQNQETVSIPAAPALNQEFGDTKSRIVTYEAVATSRFREYFPAALQTNSANFTNSNTANTAVTPPPPLVVLSTARPTPPSVLYVVPTYQWSSQTSPATATTPATTTNTRLGGGLRVFVDRPWFTSGNTEQLGVLVTDGTTSATLNDYVSQWGIDPIRFPQGATASAFTGALIPAPTSISTGVPLAEGLGSVNVYGFAPTAFDAARNLWYFDIELSNALLEAPFVRLALTRFQPHSLQSSTTDLRLSTVVRADIVKLSQDRTASYVTNSDNSVSVTVSGLVFANESWSPGQTSYGSGRVLVAQVLEATATNPGEFDWTPVGAQLPLNSAQTGGNASTLLAFTGKVPMPAGLKTGAKHQLQITELELFSTDAEARFPGTQTVANYPAGQYQPYESTGSVGVIIIDPASTSRVIFSDVLPLPY